MLPDILPEITHHQYYFDAHWNHDNPEKHGLDFAPKQERSRVKNKEHAS
jgi:hypothetical protein